ncbi:MAG: hypothetical protein OXQ29_00455 [Rhodospirillaceae bacterium]|nr:hypothetical protein [Rhodospirillaceae bacterium]
MSGSSWPLAQGHVVIDEEVHHMQRCERGRYSFDECPVPVVRWQGYSWSV